MQFYFIVKLGSQFFFCSLHFTSSLLAPYPGEGSLVWIRRLQKFLSSASSSTTHSSRISQFTRSRHLPLGLPLGRLPGISMSITCLRLLSCSLRCTCPNHLSLLSLCFLYSLPQALFCYLHSSFCLSLSPPWFFSAFSFLSSLEYFPLSFRSSSILLHTRCRSHHCGI